MQKITITKTLKNIILASAFSLLSLNAWSETAFSGETGGNLKFFSETASTQFNPQITLDTYFSGQTLFTPHAWFRMGFSVNAGNLCRPSALENTLAGFNLDEISLSFHSSAKKINNYFTMYLGNTDSFGTDILFGRLFNKSSVVSRITLPEYGYGYNLLLNQSGIGFQDLIRFEKPVALGFYAYGNYVETGFYKVNGDLRFTGSTRLFSFDMKAGAEYSIVTKSAAISPLPEKLNWSAGLEMLLGNSHTQGLFLQASVKNGSISIPYLTAKIDDIFVLIEPRLLIKSARIHLTAFSVPDAAVAEMPLIQGNTGINLNIFYDSMGNRSNGMNLGINASLSFANINLMNLQDVVTEFLAKSYNILITPYYEGNVLEGKLKISANVDLMKILQKDYLHCAGINFGWKTTF